MNTLSSLLKFIAESIAPTISDQTAKKVLAAPNGAAGKPSFRELQGSDITSGTFSAERIPSLDASKIGSGTLSANRIPTIPVSKVSGALSTANLTNATFVLDNQIMTDNEMTFSIPADVAGYTLIGVVGVRFSGATVNPLNPTGVVLRGYTFNSSSSTVSVYARKVVSAGARIKVSVTCLYKR